MYQNKKYSNAWWDIFSISLFTKYHKPDSRRRQYMYIIRYLRIIIISLFFSHEKNALGIQFEQRKCFVKIYKRSAKKKRRKKLIHGLNSDNCMVV